VTEALYGLERPDGRLPLFVLVVTDRSGHVLHAAVCDAEDYDSWPLEAESSSEWG
jgi:hypothetical protein